MTLKPESLTSYMDMVPHVVLQPAIDHDLKCSIWRCTIEVWIEVE